MAAGLTWWLMTVLYAQYVQYGGIWVSQQEALTRCAQVSMGRDQNDRDEEKNRWGKKVPPSEKQNGTVGMAWYFNELA